MPTIKSLSTQIERYKPYIWALMLSSVVAKHAIGNIILIAVGLCFIIQVIANRKFQFKKSYNLLLVYFIFGSFSLIWTTNLTETLNGISRSTYLVLIPFFLSQYEKFSPPELRKMLRVTGIILLTYFFVSLLNSAYLFAEDGNINHFFYHDLTLLSSNNAIYISLITGTVFLVLFNLNNKKRIDTYICFGLLVYLLLLSSKIMIITTLVIQLFLFVRNLNSHINPKKLIFFSIVSVLILTSLFIVDNPLKDRFLDLSLAGANDIWEKDDFLGQSFNGLTIRMFQWRIVMEMFISGNLGFLGLGWNNVDYLSAQYFSYYNFYRGYFTINFHNQYLQTLGELGILGLLLLIFTVLKGIVGGWKKNIYLLIFSILISCSFFTESLLSRQKGLIIFTVFYCILFHLNFENPVKRNSKK